MVWGCTGRRMLRRLGILRLRKTDIQLRFDVLADVALGQTGDGFPARLPLDLVTKFEVAENNRSVTTADNPAAADFQVGERKGDRRSPWNVLRCVAKQARNLSVDLRNSREHANA